MPPTLLPQWCHRSPPFASVIWMVCEYYFHCSVTGKHWNIFTRISSWAHTWLWQWKTCVCWVFHWIKLSPLKCLWASCLHMMVTTILLLCHSAHSAFLGWGLAACLQNCFLPPLKSGWRQFLYFAFQGKVHRCGCFSRYLTRAKGSVTELTERSLTGWGGTCLGRVVGVAWPAKTSTSYRQCSWFSNTSNPW